MDAEAEPRMLEALRAAQMYYLQNLTMEAIARELQVSRSSVSRLLAHARATGLVDIQIHSPVDRTSRIERAMAERYRVVAHVVPMPETISDVDRLDRVALTAGRILNQFVESNLTIGIAWGSTLGAVSRHLIPKETHNSFIVQVNGAGNNQTTGIEYASEILQRFGKSCSAQVQQFPVPAIFDDPLTKEALWRERSIKRVLGLQARMDVLVFGLGSPFAGVPSKVYIGGYLDPKDYRSLGEDGVVGDLATVFYRADGSYRDVKLNARSSGPDLGRLSRVPRRICIVAGPQKLAAVQGALAAGAITDLVLDEGLARLLTESQPSRLA